MLQKVIGKMRKAIEDFDMIQDGDKIAVGLSGGKDSITLLHALNNLIWWLLQFILVLIILKLMN